METRETLGPCPLSEGELTAWGERIGREVEPPLWVALVGPLGAGKSVLARAVCRGAGIGGHIPSPSFTLVQEYRSPRGFRVHHVDLYRLEVGDSMDPLGWEELLVDPGLVLLEWADRAGDQQPPDRWEVALSYGGGPDQRVVEVTRVGESPELIGW
jgi:tRNA threonylcarbamoyladenosine biosynthesis protein TsaE